MVTVGFDLDGFLYDWHSVVQGYYKKFKGIDLPLDKFWTEFIPGLDKQEQDYIISVPLFYYGISMHPAAVQFLDWADKNFTVFYVTSRPEDCLRVTEKYLRDHRFPQYENLIFSSDKQSVARLYKMQYFVDDFIKHVEPLSKVTTAILYAKPWNREAWDKYPTAHSYNEVRRFMESQ